MRRVGAPTHRAVALVLLYSAVAHSSVVESSTSYTGELGLQICAPLDITSGMCDDIVPLGTLVLDAGMHERAGALFAHLRTVYGLQRIWEQHSQFPDVHDLQAQSARELIGRHPACYDAMRRFFCTRMLVPCFVDEDAPAPQCQIQCIQYVLSCPAELLDNWSASLCMRSFPSCGCRADRTAAPIPPECHPSS